METTPLKELDGITTEEFQKLDPLKTFGEPHPLLYLNDLGIKKAINLGWIKIALEDKDLSTFSAAVRKI